MFLYLWLKINQSQHRANMSVHVVVLCEDRGRRRRHSQSYLCWVGLVVFSRDNDGLQLDAAGKTERERRGVITLHKHDRKSLG